jgi:ribosome-associated translation inhibitor RaiA
LPKTAARFSVSVSGTLSGAEARAHVRRRLERSLGRFARRIGRATVHCRDVNGPRGGVDQACRIELGLPGLPDVRVEKRGETPRAAFDLALPAARRALRRLLSQRPKRAQRGKKPRPARAAAGGSARRRANAEEGSLIGRRVGRAQENLRRAAARPEKERRDVWVDTAQPGTSASDRRVGAGSTARRNTKLATRGMTSALEDSARSRPSRKSTRKSKDRGKRDTNLRLRASRRAHAPSARARKAEARPPGPRR